MYLKSATLSLGLTAFALIATRAGPAPAQLQGPKTYKVLTQSDGYLLHVTPSLMDGFPTGATVEVTLDDPTRGKTTVRGTATKVSATSFSIKTSQKLKFQASAATRVLMRRSGLRTKVTPGSSGCSGCPRDANMLCDDPPNCTICWCWAELGAQQGSSPGTALTWTCGGKREPILKAGG